MDMKHQEQVLLRDRGIPDDSLFYGWSTLATPGTTYWVEKGDYRKAFELYFDGMGKRASTAYANSNDGTQIFDSTRLKRPLFNEVINRKNRYYAHPVGWFAERYYTSTRVVVMPFWRFNDVAVTGSQQPLPNKINWDESEFASNRAWWAMQPRFEGDFQALNFLYELKDFKSVAKAITALRPSKLVETLKRAKSRINRANRAISRGSTLRNLKEVAAAGSRSAGEVVLIKHFAIDPTIGDLTTLYAQMQDLVSDAQHRFRQKGEKGDRRHYSETIREEDSSTIDAKSNYFMVKKGLIVKDTFTATMEYSFDYKMRDFMAAFRRMYGLDLSAGVAWNAIPFSFLADYFIKIGDAIENMSTDPNVLLKLHQYCESRLYDYKYGWTYTSDDRTRAFIINGRPAAEGQIIHGWNGSLYHRRVVPPRKGIALPKVQLPSVKQAVNIAALVRCMW
jgi:hypothetical protein